MTEFEITRTMRTVVLFWGRREKQRDKKKEVIDNKPITF